jgi:hypothetical protein
MTPERVRVEMDAAWAERDRQRLLAHVAWLRRLAEALAAVGAQETARVIRKQARLEARQVHGAPEYAGH